MSERPQGVSRSSSFTRSLYASQGDVMNGGDEEQPGPGMRRQRSRRRISVRERSSGDNSTMAAAAAAVTASVTGSGSGSGIANSTGTSTGTGTGACTPSRTYGEVEPNRNHSLPSSGEENAPPRQSSWYSDALLQSGTEDLSAILGQVQDAADAAEATRSDEDEVLEQYRIMAHVEANIRVKDNTGFDMAEYEKRRKLQPEPTKGDYYTGNNKPKPKLPEPRIIASSTTLLLPEEPPLPPARANRRFIEQRTQRVPELCPGVIVRGQSHLPDGEHFVKCLGCKALMRVGFLTSLVSCPECSTVSPATPAPSTAISTATSSRR